MGPHRRSQIKAVATFMILLSVLALSPAAVSAADLSGVYLAQGAPVLVAFTITASGPIFFATILTYGAGGRGRWFAVIGTTDGVASGTGRLLLPEGFAFTQPPGGGMTFQLDGPGSSTGSYTLTGLDGLVSLTSGRLVRVFP